MEESFPININGKTFLHPRGFIYFCIFIIFILDSWRT